MVRPVIPALGTGDRRTRSACQLHIQLWELWSPFETAAAISLKVRREHKLHMRWVDGQGHHEHPGEQGWRYKEPPSWRVAVIAHSLLAPPASREKKDVLERVRLAWAVTQSHMPLTV